MPKIAIFMNSLSGGGMERAMLNLANFFTSEGASVDLLVASAKGPLLEEIPTAVNLINLEESKAKFETARYWLLKAALTVEPWFIALFFARKLPKAIKVIPGLIAYINEYSPDVVVSTPTTANLALLWAKSRSNQDVKTVIREATTLSEEVGNKKTTFFRLIKRFVEKWYNSSNAVVCVSDGVKQDLCKNFHVDEDKVHAVYNILDIKRIKRKASLSEGDSLIGRYGDFVLSIGRLEKEKDFVTLIRAFHLIANKVLFNLVILGEGIERSNLEKLIQELSLTGRVFLPGFIINPYPFIAKCEVFALSSCWEGCPNVLREAMVLQKKIISTDCPSGAREILSNGRYGKLVEVGDYESYSNELLNLIEISIDTNFSSKVVKENEASMRFYRSILVTL